MTTLTLDLSDETARKLQAFAARQGRAANALALEIIEQKLNAAIPELNLADRPYSEWRREFLEWANSRPQIDVTVDDSRETIYEGR